MTKAQTKADETGDPIMNAPNSKNPILFSLGQVVATPGVLSTFPIEFQTECLARHLRGDWGDTPEEDKHLNEAVVTDYPDGGDRILSSYKHGVEPMWVITEGFEGDRVTTLLKPDEY
jgi:hypothetical protein